MTSPLRDMPGVRVAQPFITDPSRTIALGLAVSAIAVFLAAGTLMPSAAQAAGTYDTGATDTTIRIGNTEAYSGPASSYGTIGRTQAAYFKMINDQGGINGRKIEFISPTMTATARPRLSSRRVSSWRATRCSSFSIRSARRPSRLDHRNTST